MKIFLGTQNVLDQLRLSCCVVILLCRLCEISNNFFKEKNLTAGYVMLVIRTRSPGLNCKEYSTEFMADVAFTTGTRSCFEAPINFATSIFATYRNFQSSFVNSAEMNLNGSKPEGLTTNLEFVWNNDTRFRNSSFSSKNLCFS